MWGYPNRAWKPTYQTYKERFPVPGLLQGQMNLEERLETVTEPIWRCQLKKDVQVVTNVGFTV
jgi:hypothetical protein